MDAIDRSVNARGAFLARLTPGWHGLGEVLPDLSMEKIVNHPGIDYRVYKDRIRTETADKTVPGQYATVRSDNDAPLAIVGKKYNVLQHTDEFRLFDEVLTPAGYTYETAGVLMGGAEVFLLAKRPESILIAEGDMVRQFLLLRFSYDGKSKQRVKTIAERVVCKNTLAIGLGETGSKFDYSILHTASAQDRMQELRDSLDVAQVAFSRFESQAKKLAVDKYSPSDLSRVMRSVVAEALGEAPDGEKERESYKVRLVALADGVADNLGDPLQNIDGIGGTKWSLYNAISQWADHTYALGVKGSDREKAERRFMSVVGGKAHEVKVAAWQNLIAA